jgi:hypothetical protein
MGWITVQPEQEPEQPNRKTQSNGTSYYYSLFFPSADLLNKMSGIVEPLDKSPHKIIARGHTAQNAFCHLGPDETSNTVSLP